MPKVLLSRSLHHLMRSLPSDKEIQISKLKRRPPRDKYFRTDTPTEQTSQNPEARGVAAAHRRTAATAARLHMQSQSAVTLPPSGARLAAAIHRGFVFTE